MGWGRDGSKQHLAQGMQGAWALRKQEVHAAGQLSQRGVLPGHRQGQFAETVAGLHPWGDPGQRQRAKDSQVVCGDPNGEACWHQQAQPCKGFRQGCRRRLPGGRPRRVPGRGGVLLQRGAGRCHPAGQCLPAWQPISSCPCAAPPASPAG